MAQNFSTPLAYMGYVGFVRLNSGVILRDDGENVNHGDYIIRVTSADINQNQDITAADVVDSRYDRTVYQLGPRSVEGSWEFPAVYETHEDEVNIFEILYRYAVTRNSIGFLSLFDMDVRYGPPDANNEADFRYIGCAINSWDFTAAQGESVNCSINIMGKDRDLSSLDSPGRSDSLCSPAGTGRGKIGTTRNVNWSDARVEISGLEGGSVGGQFIRSCSASINNNLERYYTLNGNMTPQSIAPRKRDISGEIVVLGRHPRLAASALNNENNCTTSLEVKIGFITPQGGQGCSGSGFNVTFPSSILMIENMSVQNDVLETTHSWQSYPNAGIGVCDPLLESLGSTDFDYLSE